jgi:hypothetical protein
MQFPGFTRFPNDQSARLGPSSNDEVDQILRDIPAWAVLKWKVTPLQSFKGRADKERGIVEALKKESKAS